MPIEAEAEPPFAPLELLFPQEEPPLAMTVVAVPNQESSPGEVSVLPRPTVTVYVFPSITEMVLRAYAPPPPPPPRPLLVRVPPRPPPPQHSTVTWLTPAGTTKEPDALYVCVIWLHADVKRQSIRAKAPERSVRVQCQADRAAVGPGWLARLCSERCILPPLVVRGGEVIDDGKICFMGE